MQQKLKDYYTAKDTCAVRSAIYRASKPEIKYWYNQQTSLDKRVSDKDKIGMDWLEYDPRDEDDGSLFMYND